ncbi:hypothetical protein [Pseudomonas sp. B21-040]
MGWRQRGPRKNLTSCPGLVDHYNHKTLKEWKAEHGSATVESDQVILV